MRIGLVFVVCLGGSVFAANEESDTSRRSVSIHPSRFRLVEDFSIGAVNHLSPMGHHAIRYRGNDLLLFPVSTDRSPLNLEGHVRNIHDAGWSKNGKILASTGYDGQVKVWNVFTGTEMSSVRANVGFS